MRFLQKRKTWHFCQVFEASISFDYASSFPFLRNTAPSARLRLATKRAALASAVPVAGSSLEATLAVGAGLSIGFSPAWAAATCSPGIGLAGVLGVAGVTGAAGVVGVVGSAVATSPLYTTA